MSNPSKLHIPKDENYYTAKKLQQLYPDVPAWLIWRYVGYIMRVEGKMKFGNIER